MICAYGKLDKSASGGLKIPAGGRKKKEEKPTETLIEKAAGPPPPSSVAKEEKEIYKDVMWFLCAIPVFFFWFWGGVFHSQRLVDIGDRLKIYQKDSFL